MAINSMNGVTFGNEQQKKSSGSGGFVTATTLGGAAIGAFAIKEEMGASKALTADKFELRGDKLDDKQTEAKATADEARAANTKEALEKTAKDRIDALKVEGDSMKADDYYKAQGVEKPEKLQEALDAESGKTANLETEANNAANKVKDKQTAYDSAKTAKETADKGTDEAAKAKAKTDFETAEKELNEATNTKNEATKKLAENQKKVDTYKFVKENEKEGKILKETVKGKFIAEEEAKNLKTMEGAIEKLKGKLPKVASVKKGLWGAAIGLVAGLILAKIAAPKKEAVE